MQIIAPGGVSFHCKCGTIGSAQVASDFNCTCCNGEDNYFIVCPNCGKKHEVDESKISPEIKPYIHKKVVGYGNID